MLSMLNNSNVPPMMPDDQQLITPGQQMMTPGGSTMSVQAPRGQAGPIMPNAEFAAEQRMMEFLLDQPSGTDAVYGQLDAYMRAIMPHQKFCEIGKQCIDFLEGRQWTKEEEATLDAEGRPKLTLNKINSLVRLIIGYYRQNRYELALKPGNNGSGVQETAESLTALFKQIDEQNQTKWKDATVFQDGITCSRGFWDVRLDFEKIFRGEVREKADDPFNIIIDPEAEDYNPESWGFVIEERWMSISDIFLLYGPKAADDVTTTDKQPIADGGLFAYYHGMTSRPIKYFGLDELDREFCSSYESIYSQPGSHINRHRKLIRVIDRQHYQLRRVNYLVDLQTGVEQLIPDNFSREQMQRILQYAQLKGYQVDIRSGIKRVVRWTTTAGNRLLFDDWSPYARFTKIPFFPYFRRGVTRGMIEDLIEPQKEINKRRSAFLHIVMSTANAGWMYPKGSLEEDMQAALEEEGARPGIHIEYDTKDGKLPPPQRIEPATSPVAMKKLEDDAASDLHIISGVNESAMGMVDKVQSGVAVEARQRQAILGAEVYFDNFSMSRELKGRHRLDIVQKYYNEERIIRLRGDDGEEETHIINQTAAGEIKNNISLGQYEVVVDEAPLSASFQQGQFDQAMEMRERGVPIPDDVLVDLSSMPAKQRIKKRIMEQNALMMEQQQLAVMGQKLQMGMPPDMPAPPVIDDGVPAVVEAPTNPLAGNQPGVNGSIPSPMSPAAPVSGQPPMPPAPPMAPPPVQLNPGLMPQLPPRR